MANDPRTPEPGEHVLLVAFEVSAATRDSAEDKLLELLATLRPAVSWWVAEDERRDGSDRDSAVFVAKGNQPEGIEALQHHGVIPY